MTTVTVLYFASLRDTAGMPSEIVETDAADMQALYGDLQSRHGFTLPVGRLRVAVDGAFANWADTIDSGSEIAFIPPVSGG